MDEKLVEAAVGAMLGAFAKSAAESAVVAGKSAWAWLRGRLSPADAATAQAIEAAPEKPSSRSKLTGLLQDALEADAGAAAELRALLGGEAGVQAIRQSLTVNGDGNNTALVAGSGNDVRIG